MIKLEASVVVNCTKLQIRFVLFVDYGRTFGKHVYTYIIYFVLF